MVSQRLRSSLPTEVRIGCVHGDFQWSNLLFNENGPVALIDWEISSIGPILLDLGWISFFADRINASDTAVPALLSPEEMVSEYAEVAKFQVDENQVRWFRAFASYRFGVITCFNLMLHRRGKRHDPHWEEMAPRAPWMFERGLELLN